MSNSIKMARLDYFTFKPQIAVYVELIFMITLFSVMGTPFASLNMTGSWFAALVSMNIFAIQEKNELERLYASLSFSLKNIIGGRYIFTYVNYTLGVIISIFIGVLVSALQNKNVDYADIILGICISLCAFTIITGVQIPMYFKSGYTKARAWCLIPFVIVIAIFFLPSFVDVLLDIIISHPMILGIVCLIVSLAILPVSYHLSVMCYQKRR